MVAKGFNTVPGAAYEEGQGSTKVMVWKLGQDFLRLKGKYWVENF